MCAAKLHEHERGLLVQGVVERVLEFSLEDDFNTRSHNMAFVMQDLSQIMNQPSHIFNLNPSDDQGEWMFSDESEAQACVWPAALRTICRFADEVPFEDVRNSLRSFLLDITSDIERHSPGLCMGIQIPRSWLSLGSKICFLPEPKAGGPSDEIIHRIFIQQGKITHFHRVMRWHPQYLEKFHATFHESLHSQGQLLVAWRHFLCIMAAARHSCGYLLEMSIREFLKCEGSDGSWLAGLSNLPSKLANIAELNALLAHQPWLITRSHMEKLMRGGDAWSAAELGQALIIMVTFHSLCGLVWALGIQQDSDSLSPHISQSLLKRASQHVVVKEHKVWNKEIEAAMHEEETVDDSPDDITKPFAVSIVESESDKDFVPAPAMTPQSRLGFLGEVAANVRGKYAIVYEDFDVKSKDYHVFRAGQWSWAENGFETVRHVFPAVADLLDAEFEHVYNMTDGTINLVDTGTTAPFRHAVWFYTHLLFGIIHDDYNYQMINKLLPKKIKHLIKRTVCHPEMSKPSQLDDLDVDLQANEQVHVLLLATEAKKQAALLFGLRAIAGYKTDL
eukprot:c3709_g1_i1.p1 GENE.c3709_g1_i1~~c3709_g1_i1.p1  ORF type:complete len:562 (-),score=136.82 c3709_g1_i1:148-1833(-)